MKGVTQNHAVPLLIGLIRIIRGFCQRQERETCHKLGLTASQLAFLLAMPEQAEFNVQQVSEIMGLSPSRASRVADSLVRRSLLSRRTVDSDRRIQLLALTLAGRTKWQAARKLLVECEEKLLSKLTAQGSRELEQILTTLVNAW